MQKAWSIQVRLRVPYSGHAFALIDPDIKPSNVLVNYDPLDGDITEIQLADLENTVSKDSRYAIEGDPIGTSIFRSTEATLQMHWGTATDVWSFGTMIWPHAYFEHRSIGGAV